MEIVLPDGSKKTLEAGATVADVAASIGAGLVRAALGGKIDGGVAPLRWCVFVLDFVGRAIGNRSYLYCSYFLNMMLPLCPPNPNELDMAYLTSAFLGSFGTMSKSHSSSFTL